MWGTTMQVRTWQGWVGLGMVALMVGGCMSTGVNPTGLAGLQLTCPEGPRQVLDCRGALQQFARDFKADLQFVTAQTQAGIGTLATKLTEADALTSDLIQHYYQSCALYNGCILSQKEYVAKTEKLQDIQLQVRRSILSYGMGAQQNIQINPPMGGVYPPSPYGVPPGGGPFPSPGDYPPTSSGPVSPGSYPVPPPSQGWPAESTARSGPPAGVPAGEGSSDKVDHLLNILRQGALQLREQTPPAQPPTSQGVPASPSLATSGEIPGQSPAPPSRGPAMAAAQSAQTVSPLDNLDASLQGMLDALTQDILRRNPSPGSTRTVVGNFTEEGQPWGSPLGALLQERVKELLKTQSLFNPVPTLQPRGISIAQVAVVTNPNDPKALGAIYGTDLAITGTYRVETSHMVVRLVALNQKGDELAQAQAELPRQAIASVVAATPINGADTRQLLQSFQHLGPQSRDGLKVEVTTGRPGGGASFRMGDVIRYFVTSTMDGYLYLFHADADNKMLRIFPNQYQSEARIKAGTTVEVPGANAPFQFEASPPFGLETTLAIVTTTPLDEGSFQMIESGFARPTQDIAMLVAARGIRTRAVDAPASGPPSQVSSTAPPQLVWNVVTVLIRP